VQLQQAAGDPRPSAESNGGSRTQHLRQLPPAQTWHQSFRTGVRNVMGRARTVRQHALWGSDRSTCCSKRIPTASGTQPLTLSGAVRWRARCSVAELHRFSTRFGPTLPNSEPAIAAQNLLLPCRSPRQACICLRTGGARHAHDEKGRATSLASAAHRSNAAAVGPQPASCSSKRAGALTGRAGVGPSGYVEALPTISHGLALFCAAPYDVSSAGAAEWLIVHEPYCQTTGAPHFRDDNLKL
jgi:hypothetical protein